MNSINVHNLQTQFLNFHILKITFHAYIFLQFSMCKQLLVNYIAHFLQ